MKRTIITAAICGCLLIGSLYPRMILKHHLRLVDEKGNVTKTEEIDPEIPLRIRCGLTEILSSL